MRKPWTVDGVPFLRGDEPDRAVRLPSVGTVDASLLLMRYATPPPGDHPVGFATLHVVLDLGAPVAAVERAETGLPPSVGDVVHPVLGPTVVCLHVLGREVARAEVAGYRPVVTLGGVLSATEATLLRQTVEHSATTTPVSATAEGTIPVSHRGGTVRVTLAGRPDDGATAAAVADWLADAVEVDGVDRRLGLALAAARLYRPAPSARSWSLVPGWPAPEYEPDAPLLPRSTSAGHVKLTIDPDTALPWFAAGPVSVAPDAIRMRELPDPQVRSVQLRADIAGGPVTVEFDAGDTTRTVELTDEVRTVRFLVPPGGDGSYRWRTSGGPWRTGDTTVLFVEP